MHLQLIYKENKGAAKQKLGGVRKKGGAKKRGVHAPPPVYAHVGHLDTYVVTMCSVYR